MILLAAVPYRTFPDFQLGPVTIRTFGLMVATGIIVGAMVGARYVANRGIDPDEFTNMATKAAVAGLVGARLTWVLSHLDQIQSPIDVIAVWEGGVQFSGGLAFGALAGWLLGRNRYSRSEGWALVDGASLGLVVGLVIGRLGCIAVGEHFGGETTFALGMTYRGGGTVEPEPAIGTTIHNTAFYEFLHLLVLLAIIALILRRAGNRRAPLVPGTLGALVLVWYGIGRFTTDLTRVNDTRAAGLTGAQWAAVALVLVGSWLIATGSRRQHAIAARDVPEEARRPAQSTIRVIPDDSSGDGEPGTDSSTVARATVADVDQAADHLDDLPEGPTPEGIISTTGEEPMSHVRITQASPEGQGAGTNRDEDHQEVDGPVDAPDRN